MIVELHHVVDPALERELVALVARALPDPHLHGRWYWDSRPDAVVVARVVAGGPLVGLRLLIRRDVVVGARRVSIVGTGVAVDPAWQRQGIATALTERLLTEAEGRAAVVVFLGTEQARPLLDRFGFAPLTVPVTSLDPRGIEVVESAPCLVKELQPGFVAAVVAAGALCVGSGTW